VQRLDLMLEQRCRVSGSDSERVIFDLTESPVRSESSSPEPSDYRVHIRPTKLSGLLSDYQSSGSEEETNGDLDDFDICAL